MECTPSVSPETFHDMKTADDKLNVLYDMQAITMKCVAELEIAVTKRKYFDRTATVIGGIVGGALGAVGIKVGW